MKYFMAIIILLMVVSCSRNDLGGNFESNNALVVSKIYDYSNALMAEYDYNDNNQLLKKSRIVNGEEVATHEFEYTNNRATRIIYKNFELPAFNHERHIFYNDQGLIIKDEVHHYGSIIETNDYIYNEQGKIQEVATFSEGVHTFHTYFYNNTENVEHVTAQLPELNDGGIPTGNTIEVNSEYDYDSGTKPNFGIEKVFQIEPLPGFGTEAMFEKNSSLNNITKNYKTGTQWVYTYNENNLVGTIETIWAGIETEEPILLRIEYKLIN